jgi:hypothetical protein
LSSLELIFVYNADSGLFSSITDFAHKILSPSTYQCQLCALTHGNFSIKKEWKSFIETLPLKTVFLYKDEFIRQNNMVTAFPAVLLSKYGVIVTLLTKKEIENCKSLQELKSLVTFKLLIHDQHYHSNI